MLFNIYIENHGKRDGVEDIVNIVTQVFEKRGHEVIVSEELRSDRPNIIIDEFTNFISNKIILEFKSEHPESRFILVLTEFLEERFFVRSFNFFGGIFDAALIAALNIYIRLRRVDFLRPSLRDWLVAVFYLPFLAVFLTTDFAKALIFRDKKVFISRFYKLAYLHMRFLGLERMHGLADSYITCHESISDGLRLLVSNNVFSAKFVGVIYPEFDLKNIGENLFKDKKLFIEITGSVTTYRKSFLRTIDIAITALGIKNKFGLCQSISFGMDRKDIQRAAYSLHPPQYSNWKYSSPTRIFRALNNDYNIPVSTKYFGQNPIEEVCILFEGDKSIIHMYELYQNPDVAWQLIESKIKEYNRLASQANDLLIDKVTSNLITKRQICGT